MRQIHLLCSSLWALWCIVGSRRIEVKRQTCQDEIANCQDYGNTVCSQYRAWAQHNCPRYCAFCSGGSQPSGQNGEPCVDVIDNCAALGPNVCHDYVEFVHINCQKTCNLCNSGGASQCQDKLSNCAAYDVNTVCKGQYAAWARDNCAHTCNLCPAGSSSGVITGISNECYYKGQGYKEGQQWTDGCEKNCTCIDQHKGHYLCQDLCPTYKNLPADCHMVTEPGQCCAKPQCPPRRGCQYKGQVYSVGQQWKDGCQYLCNCKDGTQGYYECRALCVTWNLLPSCHLDDPAPGKCCRTPNCPANIIIHYPDGYTPM